MIQLIIIAFFIIVVSLALELRKQLIKEQKEDELLRLRHKYKKIIRQAGGDISPTEKGIILTYKGIYNERKKREYTDGDVVVMNGTTHVYYKKVWHELI